MFRVKGPNKVNSSTPMTAVILLVALALAFLFSAAAVYQVFDEYKLLGPG